MLGIVIFTASLSALICINGTPLSNRELQAIIKLMEGNAEKEKSPEVSTSDSDDDHHVHYLKTEDLIKLIQQAKNKVNNEYNNPKYRARPDSYEHHYQNHHVHSRNEKIHHLGGNEAILERLLKEELAKPSQKASHHQRNRLNPNTLLSAIRNVNLKADDGGLNDYSKIFLVLDPVAIQESKNKDAASNLISKILAQSSSAVQKARQEENNSFRYKGFMVKDSTARRFRRESKESYAGGGGGEDDDYRPKRQRNDNRGGGGGGGGRTAIPYIRHRGDIYERDH